MSIKVDARTDKVKVQLRPLHPPNQDHGQRARAAPEDERKFGGRGGTPWFTSSDGKACRRELWLKFDASTGLMSCTTFIHFNTGTETNSFTSGTYSILLNAVTLHEEQKGHCKCAQPGEDGCRLEPGCQQPDHERPGGHHIHHRCGIMTLQGADRFAQDDLPSLPPRGPRRDRLEALQEQLRSCAIHPLTCASHPQMAPQHDVECWLLWHQIERGSGPGRHGGARTGGSATRERGARHRLTDSRRPPHPSVPSSAAVRCVSVTTAAAVSAGPVPTAWPARGGRGARAAAFPRRRRPGAPRTGRAVGGPRPDDQCVRAHASEFSGWPPGMRQSWLACV